MFRDKPPSQKTTINVLLGDGGMGDQLCALVAVNHIIKYYSWINPLVWVPDYLLDFSKHVLPKGVSIRDYTTGAKKFNSQLIGVTTQWKGQHTPMRTHPVDYAFHQLTDSHLYTNEDKNYLKIRQEEIDLSRFPLPKDYFVITPCWVQKVKRFAPNAVDQICEYLTTKGLTPVFLGKEKTETGRGADIVAKKVDFDASKGLNLINQTDLLESAAIIQGAKLFIGIDGGLVHLAGCTDVKIVAGYTFANSSHLMPIRNNMIGYNVFPVEPSVDLKCRFCQSNWGLLYSHDFRSCLYQDFKCVDDMSFENFKDKIDKALL